MAAVRALSAKASDLRDPLGLQPPGETRSAQSTGLGRASHLREREQGSLLSKIRQRGFEPGKHLRKQLSQTRYMPALILEQAPAVTEQRPELGGALLPNVDLS
jgi:hypothetical protein